jgi:hypothetical protein
MKYEYETGLQINSSSENSDVNSFRIKQTSEFCPHSLFIFLLIPKIKNQ